MEEIDLTGTHQTLVDLHGQIYAATSRHNAFLKNLGLPLLP